jgi:hypothetical protein
MGLDELVKYIDVRASKDMELLKPVIEKMFVDLSTKLLNTNTAVKTNSTLNAKLNATLNAKLNTNKKYGGTVKTNMTRKNTNTNTREENKYKISLLFSLIILCALSHLRGITPFIHSFMELLTVYKTDGYNKVIVPFMAIAENSFTFLKSTLLDNIKEGIYLKMMNTLNGTYFLNDPNKVIDTQVNLSKVYLFAVSLFAQALNILYTPSVTVIKQDELEPLLRDILKVLNETFKGPKGYNFMTIPVGTILMTKA